jgi:hypothetical protein
MSVWEKTGREPDALANAPALPSGMERLWQDFAELHDSRGSSGFGPMRITFGDLDAWQRIQGVTLAPWEINAIRKADNAYLASHAKQAMRDG